MTKIDRFLASFGLMRSAEHYDLMLRNKNRLESYRDLSKFMADRLMEEETNIPPLEVEWKRGKSDYDRSVGVSLTVQLRHGVKFYSNRNPEMKNIMGMRALAVWMGNRVTEEILHDLEIEARKLQP